MAKISKMRTDSVKRNADVAFSFTKNATMIREIKNIKALKSIVNEVIECVEREDVMFVDMLSISSYCTGDINVANFIDIIIDILHSEYRLRDINNQYKDIDIKIPENLPQEQKMQYLELKEREFEIKKNGEITSVNQYAEACFDKMLDVVLFYSGYYNKDARDEYPSKKQLIANKYFTGNSSILDVLKTFSKMMEDITTAIYER